MDIATMKSQFQRGVRFAKMDVGWLIAEVDRLTTLNNRRHEALLHVESQLYIDDFGDYGLLTTFDHDVVVEALKEGAL